jgi:ethanolaminephosphotransferase
VLERFLNAGKRLVFYGDDTWLRLFPRHFVRSEGVSSFFVAVRHIHLSLEKYRYFDCHLQDTKEVDDNVTRNLWPELERTDWDVLILHYLG